MKKHIKKRDKTTQRKTQEFKFTALELLFLYILFYLNLLYSQKV